MVDELIFNKSEQSHFKKKRKFGCFSSLPPLITISPVQERLKSPFLPVAVADSEGFGFSFLSKHVLFYLFCFPLGFVLGNGILWLKRAAEICPAHPDPSLQDSHSLRAFNLITPLWGLKVIPGIEPHGKRQMEIKEALRDGFMDALKVMFSLSHLPDI